MSGGNETADIEKIVAGLPGRERKALLANPPTAEELESRIAQCRRAMRRDLLIGVPWFVCYTWLLFTRGFDGLTIAVFAAGMVYFVYAIFTTGSYGLNRKRIQVYQALLDHIHKSGKA